ncbi:helix-turn-helix domain-containing protein [Metabacillus idriensis]|uniref:Recombinase RecQ n=1 Tax=Metabacillus idriensis TaxID=324768 RepID=A0A6I2MGA1_9BACI|nr:helix-turn-helix domain-containing protein [Metabacillus idriensis]MCM3596992.1 helix-turn-helix domain-containing protein [Metabacillus idriensis]MRX55481.1 recombinase RecQ [Metabacillus idriensis]OHR64409.1 hypothetical protein HMPREF3291_15135 [Bacillus sp. HMSC76G11]
MTQNYLDIVYLDCLKKFGGERSSSAVFHLLKGKKSSQTIQDSKLFHLSNLFGMYPALKRKEFEAAVQNLIENGYLIYSEKDVLILTKKAETLLETVLKNKPLPKSLNGSIFSSSGFLFWKRLMLMTQVLSHTKAGSTKYLPVTKDEKVQRWVKHFFKRSSLNKMELSDGLYQEMLSHLQRFSDREAAIWVYQLTSNQRIGLTYEQLGEKFKEDAEYIKLLFWNVIHRVLEECSLKKHQYPLLNSVIQDLSKVHPLTESTSKTLQLIQLGKSIEDIARIRHLKLSTIEDHVVEISLNDTAFDFSMFLADDCLQVIARKIEELNTHQLRIVKEALNDRYSYFQIRLAFTRL